ncbi:MAG: PcfJ domain-containing protein [Tatlockia sp.]|nr:PcfJ domain-containing protein [Tatlockia sp.]
MQSKIDRRSGLKKPFRNYYADYKTFPQSYAAVEQKIDQFSLNAHLTSKENPAWLQHFINLSAIWRTFFGKSWQELLIHHNYQIKLGEKKREEFARNFDWNCTIEQELDFLLPDLYSIPQTVWQKFIINLDSEIVAALNLKKHRHLWEAYNYVQTKINPIEKLKIAELIGNHHFLLSILKMDNTDLLSILSKNRRFTPNELFTIKTNLEKLKIKLNSGILDYELIQTIHPSFNPKFLHKVSHCVKFSEVISLADMILHYSSSAPKYILSPFIFSPVINSDLTIKATNWLFDSKKEPKQFAKNVALSKKLNDYPGLFFGSRKKFDQYAIDSLTSTKLSDYKNYINSLFKDLVLPQIIHQCSGKQINLEKCIKRVQFGFEKMITESLSIDQMEKLSKRWHRNFSNIEPIKPVKDKCWEPIINQQIINDITINAITSPECLREHGKEMLHCVGAYDDNCLKNETNILQFVDNNNLKSTLELGYLPHNQVTLIQHEGYKKSEPPKNHIQTAKLLIKNINNGKITLNAKRLIEEPKSSVFLNFDYNDLDMRERIYQAYKINKILPAKLIALNHQELMNKTSLVDLIEENIDILSNNSGKIYLIRQHEYEIKC